MAAGYYVKTEMSAGANGGGAAHHHIGSLNPNFLAGNKSSDSQGGGQGAGGVYYNNTMPTHVNGERDHLFTENYGQMQQA